MYVIIRTMKVEKGYVDKVKTRLMGPSPLLKSPGFIKRDLLVMTKNPEYDVIKVMIFFESRNAFYVWEGSPEHIAMHKNKDHEHNQKTEGIIEVTREAYDLIATETHE